MKTIIEALQDLYVAMGGQAADVADLTVTPDMIDAIADVYEDKGDTLPTVTDADNAKLLTVVNGAWDKADAAKELPAVTSTNNGSVLKVVNGAWANAPEHGIGYVRYEREEDETWQCDHTFGEIVAMFQNGKLPVAVVDGILIPLSNVTFDEHSPAEVVGLGFVTRTGDDLADLNKVLTYVVGHSALGITVIFTTSYLSNADPNT